MWLIKITYRVELVGVSLSCFVGGAILCLFI